MKDRKELCINDTVVLVQVGVIRLIGVIDSDIDEDTFDEIVKRKEPFTLYGVGNVVIQRGQKPGAIEGSFREVRLIQISTLDFALEAMGEVPICNYDFIVKDSSLDKKGRADMRKGYEDFLNRVSSMVEHHRAPGELP